MAGMDIAKAKPRKRIRGERRLILATKTRAIRVAEHWLLEGAQQLEVHRHQDRRPWAACVACDFQPCVLGTHLTHGDGEKLQKLGHAEKRPRQHRDTGQLRTARD